ncbi:MAG: uridine kinase [Vulcanimicrobiota bacterium]
MPNNLVIGIAGGSGSGKTTVAEMIGKELEPHPVVIMIQDNYYKDQAHLPVEERAKVNFDHPEAFDSELMARHLKQLKEGHAIDMPVYDFVTHTRHKETIRVEPTEILIVEGILVLESNVLRKIMDFKVYVDTDDDIRFIRRLKRDIAERARSVDSVIDQYLNTVRPMHLEFVEKSKRYADIILPWRDFNPGGVGIVIHMLKGYLKEKIKD